MSTRELVFSDGSSHKFWNILLEGNSHTVTFGRVGTGGQSKVKEFDDDEEAKKSFDKLVTQKLKKGYSDASGTSTTIPTKTASKTASRKAAKTVSNKASKAASKTASKAAAKSGASAAKATGRKATMTKKAAKTASARSADVAADVNFAITQEIDLDPTDWFGAGFRKRSRLPLQEERQGDLAAAISRLENLKTETYGWRLKYETLRLKPKLPKEEAHFWFLAMTGNPGRLADKTAVKRYANKIASSGKINGKLTFSAAKKLVANVKREVPDPLMVAALSLFSATECLQFVLSRQKTKRTNRNYEASEHVVSLCRSFRQHVLPYLDDDEISELQEHVRKTFDASFVPPDSYASFPAEHYLAAILGMHAEVYEAVSAWDDAMYSKSEYWIGHYQDPQSLLCGLESAELVESQWRRLQLPIVSPEQARHFLACTEFSALDVLADQICRESNKEDAAKLMKVLCLVRSPEAAEPILQCRLNSKAPSIARDWLDRECGNAVKGLIDTAAGKGKLADAAIEYLRGLKRAGHADFLAKQVKAAGKKSEGALRIQREVIDHEEKTYKPLDDKTTPKWLATELAAVDLPKKPKLPSWAAPSQLPPLIVAGPKGAEYRLNDDQMVLVLEVLSATPVTDKNPLLAAIKEHIDKASRDAFAWRLFELWQEDGSNSKTKWAMGAIGHLGDDHCVLKLTPMVRVWPGESQHARAVFGLECLRGVGTSTALMQLSGIAQKLKFKGLKTKAAAFVEDIAKERGMTRAELEDRVIPDCELDEHGRREFSFGDRSFSFVLGADLKPMVRDAAGKVRPNMPKPGVKDNHDVASASIAQWKLIKKQIKEVATLQAGRLEQAMVTGRRWRLKDFESLLVRHPLMTHLVQKLLWGSFAPKGKLQKLFRVTEERDYADVADDTITLDSKNAIGVLHPLELSDSQRSAWGNIMSDYEIVAPFPQLGRDVYSIEKGLEKKTEIPEFAGIQLAAPTMVFTLEKFGWTRGEAMDAGCFDEHSKQFQAADVTAVIHYDGVVGMGYIDPDEMLKTESIHFCPGMRPPSGYGWGDKKKLKLADVPDVVLSEVMADLHVLKSKAR